MQPYIFPCLAGFNFTQAVYMYSSFNAGLITYFGHLVLGDLGDFQLLDLILPELKSHVIPYKFKSSHWLRANLVKDFFYK